VVKVCRSIDKIDDDIESAGQSFLGFYLGDIIKRFSEFDDRTSKNKIINEYFKSQNGFYDNHIENTRVRVNAAIRIIKACEVKYALKKIDGFKVDPRAVNKAKETLRKIISGELRLPSFQ